MSTDNKSGTIRSKVEPNEKNTLTIRSNLNRFQSNFENQLFTRGTSNVPQRLSYVYPFYFYYYFRGAFLLCLVPFWLELKEQTNITLKRYKLHSALCAVIHISCLVLSILDFRLATAQSLKVRPGKVFEMVNFLFLTMFLLVFAKVVRSQQLTKLFEQPLPRMTRKVKLNSDFVKKISILGDQLIITLVIF